ncbi:peptidoglycan DD-metalloendopeptidase family protein [Vallitalea pronyensis]|uniref:Peptidoglycan DD-metalloendopeptidase family protein n=1 Tax=Vallitalea pronyensis TaxID=1348613 RepID=A0A8J8MI05_9FIRM|nr:M23 family metallopeptidase [Vallitalea pronyensis]QUI21811.1 peptidoglycan DD-metalloendopeptidase family protein [Vallitalea pronyensis]
MRPLYIKMSKNKFTIVSLLVLSILVTTLLIREQVHGQYKVIYKATFKNSEVGFIEDIGIIDEALKAASTRLEKQLDRAILIDETVITQPLELDKQKLLNEKELADELFTVLLYNKDDFWVKAKALSIDNETEIILEDDQAAEAVLAEVKSAYITPVNAGEIQDVSFVESVEASEVYVNSERIVEKEEAVEKLQSTTEEKITYQIQSGDTLSEVANDNDMGLSDLLKINPEVTTASLLQIGQELNLMIPKPTLSVVVKEKVAYEDDIEAPIEYQEDNNEYKDYRKTIQEGESGIKKVTANVIYTNGLETGREIVSQEILVEPIKSIIAVGTRKLPRFSKPVNGELTSLFGPRWGSIHRGIDLRASVGTSVKASETGTVTFASWSGGYGYLVKIKHADGFETYYAHNSKLYVKVGEKVNKGDVVAASGNTGNSQAPHVHFEIRRYGKPLNPLNYVN